jgi:protease-4
MYTSGTYYLASACDKVVIAPSGISLVSGLAISITYYAETLEKLGVEPEFEHVGDFKSAVEPFERTAPSEAATQAYNDLIDALYEEMVAGIASGRGLPPEQVRANIDAMRLTPEVALERGMVDAIAFPDAVAKTLDTLDAETWKTDLAAIQEDWDEKEWREHFTPLSEYVAEMRVDSAGWGKKIAIVHADGPIQSGDADQDLFGGALLTDGEFRKWMHEVREDEQIAAVVLRVNSPGGSGLASDMMWYEIERTRAAGKPVVVSMGDYAASGGYYIAANTDWIVAQPTTLTGSIGVFGGKFNLAGTFEKIGLHEAQFKRGELADMLSATSSFSEEGRVAFRDYLETFYRSFLTKVATGRKMEVDAVHAVAQGRVWTGQQALDHGLVDQLGGIEVALAKAAELGGIQDEYGIVRLPQRLLVEDLAEARSPTVEIELLDEVPGAEAAVREMVLLNGMIEDGGALLYLPGNPTIQ